MANFNLPIYFDVGDKPIGSGQKHTRNHIFVTHFLTSALLEKQAEQRQNDQKGKVEKLGLRK